MVHITSAAQSAHGRSTDTLLAQLLTVEREAWNAAGAEISASTEKIAARIDRFPQGVLTATYGSLEGPVCGSQFYFRFHWDGDISRLTSWEELTSHGNIGNVHSAEGNTGFLVGVGVVPEYRRLKFAHNLRFRGEYKVAELLIGFALDELFAAGVTQVIANARIPFYHMTREMGTPMSVDEYCKLEENGSLFDPVLRFHKAMGAEIIKPVAYSMEDAESLNGGCWVLYTSPYKGK